MVDRIRRFQVLNSQIFATLNKYLHTSTADAENMPVEHVRYNFKTISSNVKTKNNKTDVTEKTNKK